MLSSLIKKLLEWRDKRYQGKVYRDGVKRDKEDKAYTDRVVAEGERWIAERQLMKRIMDKSW